MHNTSQETDASASGSRETPLARKLAARIESEGPISLHDYMAACLYDEEFGYYRKRGSPLGAQGDFVTAPEISQLFGEMIGLWAADTWQRLGAPSPFRLIELGPGRGTLMADALRVLKVVPPLIEACTVTLVESSDTLITQQRETLEGAPVPVEWAARLEDLPAGPAILIGNEFLDCLPVRQFQLSEAEGVWCERMVALAEDRAGFAICLGDATQKTLELPEQAPPDGAVFEHRPGVKRMLDVFSARASGHPFAALLLDYGHDQPGYGDTLQAVRRHRFAGLFEAPGESDMTAHVDFAHLQRGAARTGLATFGPVPMGQFLLKLGLQERYAQLLRRASPEQAGTLTKGVARLVDPRQMGVLFKAFAVASEGRMHPLPSIGF